MPKMRSSTGGGVAEKSGSPMHAPSRRWLFAMMLATITAAAAPCHGFLEPTSTSLRRTVIPHMIGNIFTGSTEKDSQLPKDVKDAISKCRGAVQKGLEDRISRMDVEMPVGANFGVENKKGKGKRGNLSTLTGGDEQQEGLTMEKLDTSNRELARLFVEMFQPLGGEHISAIFNDEYLADQARQRWSNDVSAECQILAIDRKGKRGVLKTGKKNKKKKARGFAAKMAEEMDDGGATSSGPFNLPKDTEVAVFVSPGPKELIAIERICNEVGMGTCIILLNARISLIDKFSSADARKLFTEEFQTMWSLSAAPQEDAPGCLMHKAYPGPWVLARKPKVWAPKTIALKDGPRFSGEECKDAFGTIDVSELEKGTEKLAENMAGWFK
ncbi:hypothetical protein ACHAWF_013850 [Thalassiosira exigua]